MYHIEMDKLNGSEVWPWGVEGCIFFSNWIMVLSGIKRFGEVTSAGLNILRQKGYQISVENWIFDDPFHKKGLVLIIWVLGMIQSSRSVIFLMKWGCWGHWGHWGCWGRWGHWGCRSFKAWKTTTEDFRIIQAFEFSFIFMFWKKVVLSRIMKYHIDFLHLFCQRLLRPAHVIFLKTSWWNTNVQSSWSH